MVLLQYLNTSLPISNDEFASVCSDKKIIVSTSVKVQLLINLLVTTLPSADNLW